MLCSFIYKDEKQVPIFHTKAPGSQSQEIGLIRNGGKFILVETSTYISSRCAE